LPRLAAFPPHLAAPLDAEQHLPLRLQQASATVDGDESRAGDVSVFVVLQGNFERVSGRQYDIRHGHKVRITYGQQLALLGKVLDIPIDERPIADPHHVLLKDGRRTVWWSARRLRRRSRIQLNANAFGADDVFRSVDRDREADYWLAVVGKNVVVIAREAPRWSWSLGDRELAEQRRPQECQAGSPLHVHLVSPPHEPRINL